MCMVYPFLVHAIYSSFVQSIAKTHTFQMRSSQRIIICSTAEWAKKINEGCISFVTRIQLLLLFVGNVFLLACVSLTISLYCAPIARNQAKFHQRIRNIMLSECVRMDKHTNRFEQMWLAPKTWCNENRTDQPNACGTLCKKKPSNVFHTYP